MDIISLFCGAGGMDLGFKQAGFHTVWANEFDKNIYPSFRNYFKDTPLSTKSITEVKNEELPEGIYGVIGGPPCQSWSQAGSRRGMNDPRGRLFMEYLRVIQVTKPIFFVAENVSGIVHKRNQSSFRNILRLFDELGYNVSWKLINASDFEVPQDRKRVLIVGYKKELKRIFEFPKPIEPKVTLLDAIGDLRYVKVGTNSLKAKNHELVESGYSSIFLSRNRVRGWKEQSFTILATERHIPFHPSAPKMEKVSKDIMRLSPGHEKKYRRLSIRECARIQTFPDNYEFIYKQMKFGYKMIGNAVPVRLAYHIAKKIRADLNDIN